MTIESTSTGCITGEDSILVRRHVAPIGVLKVAFSALATLTVFIALVFAAQGLWLVLPYAAVECFAIGAAYWWIMRERDDFERITREGDLILVKTRISGSRANPRLQSILGQCSSDRVRHRPLSLGPQFPRQPL